METYLAGRRAIRFQRFTFVLGAGASYDHGYPLVREFLSPDYYRWLCDQAAGLPAGYGAPAEMLRDFLDAVDHYRGIAPDFERVLSVLDKSAGYRGAVEFLFRTLATAFDITIRSELSSTPEYLGLATMLLQHPVAGGASIVTFNYDTACEDALSSLSREVGGRASCDRLYFRYGFRRRIANGLPGATLNFSTNAPVTYPDSGILVLKLHGSINLLLCSSCGAVVYFPFQVLADGPPEYIRQSCPVCACEVRLNPFVVPPGRRKEMPPAVQELWEAADRVLASSQAVVIAGYSIPEYDDEARALLSRTLRGKAVVLVDPVPSKVTVAFLRRIPRVDLRLERMTFTRFLRKELHHYEPELLPAFAPRCEPVYLDQELMQGLKRDEKLGIALS